MDNNKKLTVGVELTDEELMEMTGGSSFRITSQKNYGFAPIISRPLYGIQPERGMIPMYGIPPEADIIIAPKYGIEPIRPLYGIDPTIK